MSRTYDNFADLITFSRASQSTVVDSDGTLKYAAHNLLPYSEDLVNNWTSVNGSIAKDETGVDGTTSAFTITPDSSVSFTIIRQSPFTISANTKLTWVFFVKKGTATTNLNLRGRDNNDISNRFDVVIDPSHTITSETVSGDFSNLTASIEETTGGFYKVTATVTTGASTAIRWGFELLGSPVGTWIVNFPHLFQADKPMQNNPAQSDANLATYVPTTSAAVYQPRIDFDPVTGDRKGLLIEEARTNLIPYSEELDNASWFIFQATVDANSETAPDGASTADKLTNEDTLFGYVFEGISLTSGNDYTYSVFLKAGELSSARILGQANGFGANIYADFDLSAGTVGSVTGGSGTASIEDFGSGWYRCVLTLAATASATSGFQMRATTSGDGVSGFYIWGVQLEEASFPTSYIPTSGATATRSADVADIQTNTFGFSANEGTLFVEADTYESTQSFRRFAEINNDSTFNNSVSLQMASGNLKAYVFSGGSTEANLTPGSISDNAFFKGAIGYQTDNVAGCIDGGSVSTDTSATMPVAANLTHLNIGTSTGSGSFQNGHIKKIQYFPRRLSDTELQEITS